MSGVMISGIREGEQMIELGILIEQESWRQQVNDIFVVKNFALKLQERAPVKGDT